MVVPGHVQAGLLVNDDVDPNDPHGFAGRLALPGDTDLDIDIEDLYITSVTVLDREVIVGAFAERGYWAEEGGPLQEVHDCEFTLSYWFDPSPAKFFDDLIAKLEGWRDNATAIRLCGSPGRLSTMSADFNTWTPLPRRPMPGMIT